MCQKLLFYNETWKWLSCASPINWKLSIDFRCHRERPYMILGPFFLMAVQYTSSHSSISNVRSHLLFWLTIQNQVHFRAGSPAKFHVSATFNNWPSQLLLRRTSRYHRSRKRCLSPQTQLSCTPDYCDEAWLTISIFLNAYSYLVCCQIWSGKFG